MKKTMIALSLGLIGSLSYANGIGVALNPTQIMSAVESYEFQLANGESEALMQLNPDTLDDLDWHFRNDLPRTDSSLLAVNLDDYYMLRLVAKSEDQGAAESQFLDLAWEYTISFDPETQLIYLSNSKGLTMVIQPALAESLD